MYAVSVVFSIKQEYVQSFRKLIGEHATRTLEREEACRRFDIGLNDANPTQVFLYELYDDKQAFDEHAASDYLADFFSIANDWIESKEASRWDIVPNPTQKPKPPSAEAQ